MNRNSRKLIAVALLAYAGTAAAGDIYFGAATLGLTGGYAHHLSERVALRGDIIGGLNLKDQGNREGVDYVGKFSSQVVGTYVDYFPTSTGFRLTGGLTFNNIKATLDATGNNASATINNKTVSLAGETFSTRVKYASTTPYLGIGWGFAPGASHSKGLGFFADLGVSIGKFKASTTSSVVGKQGITQADVDAQNAKVQDSLNKLSVLPKIALGLRYRF